MKTATPNRRASSARYSSRHKSTSPPYAGYHPQSDEKVSPYYSESHRRSYDNRPYDNRPSYEEFPIVSGTDGRFREAGPKRFHAPGARDYNVYTGSPLARYPNHNPPYSPESPNYGPQAQPTYDYRKCEHFYWEYPVSLTENDQKNEFYCFDVQLPSGCLAEDLAGLVHKHGYWVSFYFKTPAELLTNNYVTQEQNINNTHAHAQSLLNVQQSYKEREKYGDMKTQMMIKLPFRCELDFGFEPWITPVPNERNVDQHGNYILGNDIYVGRFIVRKANSVSQRMQFARG